MRILLSLSVLLLCGTAEATCRARVVQAVKAVEVVKEVAVVEKVREILVAQYIPLAVAVPTYAVGYAPAAYQAAYAAPAAVASPEHSYSSAQPHAKAACEERLAVLEKRFADLERQAASVVRPEATAPPAPTVSQPVNTGLAIGQLFTNKCATCHEAAVAKEKGGNLTLLKGGALVDLTPEQVNKVITFTYSAKMPKKPAGVSEADFQKQKLTDQDFAAIMDWASAKTKK